MNYTEIGDPLYNTSIDFYLGELNEFRNDMLTSASGIENDDIIRIAHSIKVLYRGVSEKLTHSKYAYEYLQKCSRLTDILDGHHSRNLNYLGGIKSDFKSMVERINGENFLDLMLSKHEKNRSIVFDKFTVTDIKWMLAKYELALNTLAYIEDNRLELFGGWIGYKEFSESDAHEDQFWIRDFDDTDKISSYMLLEFDEADMEFKGTEYKANHYDARMSEVQIHISACGEYKDLAKWAEKKYPQYLI